MTTSLPDHRKDIPLPAVRFRADDGTERHAVYCPWCEDIHQHGAGAGHRTAGEHCHPNRGSPLGGYELTPVKEGKNAFDAMPHAPMARSLRLSERLQRNSSGVTRYMWDIITRMRKNDRDGTEKSSYQKLRLAPSDAVPHGWQADGGRNNNGSEGNDLIDFAAYFYGVTHGVAAVRLLEAATGACLDDEAALAVSHAVEQWHARGTPRGAGRRF
jgi:hypothetical protein